MSQIPSSPTAFASLPTDLATLSPTSKLWVFPLSRPLSTAECGEIQQAMVDFISCWKAHGATVYGASTILRAQFLFVAADEERSGVSGCSIDGMFRAVERVLGNHGVEIVSPQFVQYLKGDQIIAKTRDEFQQLVTNGEISNDTIVFDNTVTSLAQLSSSGWEKSFATSWHARAFG